jgi:hypothetical protein
MIRTYLSIAVLLVCLAALLLAPLAALHAAETTAAHKSTAPITTTIPSLDELAGDWMEVATIRNFPSVNNFWGALKTHDNLTTFLYTTFPPYANGGDSGVLTINGKLVTATRSRWYPYQVLRRATVDGVELESAIRMPFEQRGVFCRLTLKNTSTNSQTVDVSWVFSGQVCRHPDAAWNRWESPHGAVGNTIAMVGADAKVLSAVGNKGSEPAAIAFAFSHAPADLKAVTDGGVAAWKITLAANQTVSLAYTTAMDKEPVAATELATHWAKSFDQSFALAKTQWEDRWHAAFTPGNKHFSGHLPTLLTDDAKIRRVYYEGVLAALMLCRTDLPAANRCFVTAGPQWAVTLMYFWDAEMRANSWAMLEPTTMKELLAKWLAMDQHGCYALDCLSGKGAGPWYAANDWSIFRCVEAYLGVTGDKAFLSQAINGKTVLQRLEDIATFYEQRPLTKDSPLADSGGPGNLLECSERYVEGVASLNAGNVYLLRRVADYCEQSGNAARAQVLRAKADKLLPFVMALYKPGDGVWSARDNAGKEVPIRHCFDYILTGQALENDLTPTTKTEMTGFVERELLTKTWMRAMSLKDPAAAHSDRPDHGPMGSYDGWPPLTMDVMCRFGAFDKAVNFLRAVEPVTHEGPFAQSHEFLDPDRRGFDPVVRIANRGYQDFNEGCGAAFAEVIIRSFFGYRPDLSGAGLPLLAPRTPRGFNGQLRHVPFHGELYTLTSDAQGIHKEKE